MIFHILWRIKPFIYGKHMNPVIIFLGVLLLGVYFSGPLYSATSYLDPLTLVVGDDKLVYSNSKVGVATANPVAEVDVAVPAQFNKVTGYGVVNKGTVSGAVTIDWNDGNVQRIVINGNSATISFVAPVNPVAQTTVLMLVVEALTEDGVHWGTPVYWPQGVELHPGCVEDSVTLMHFFYDSEDGIYLGNGIPLYKI